MPLWELRRQGDGFLPLWEPRPRGYGWWYARLFRGEGAAPTGGLPAICGSPALGAMGGGMRGFFATRASLLQGDGPAFCRSPALGAIFAFMGAPPSGRWVVVCQAFLGEGVAPTKKRSGKQHRAASTTSHDAINESRVSACPNSAAHPAPSAPAPWGRAVRVRCGFCRCPPA